MWARDCIAFSLWWSIQERQQESENKTRDYWGSTATDNKRDSFVTDALRVHGWSKIDPHIFVYYLPLAPPPPAPPCGILSIITTSPSLIP